MKIVNDYAWSTHKPLLASLVEVAEPGFILELGVGLHSTPIFLNSKCKDIIFIDSDNAWLDHVKKNNSFDDRHEIFFHDLGSGKGKHIFPKDLSAQQKLEIIKYYENLALKISSKAGKPKMVFVDNMTCCRTLAINTLYKYFDIITYHDCEPVGISWYEYYFEKNLKKEFKHYILKTPKSWTGCFISYKLDIDADLKSNIKKHILKYSEEIGIEANKIYLEESYNE
jgi:hypothetical protein